MPRSTEEILAHADDLARRFEEHKPVPGRVLDAGALRDIAAAIGHRARAERDIARAVGQARADGHSWTVIGAMLGTSGEAARQRYGLAGKAGERRRRTGTSRSRTGSHRDARQA
ncbi:MAG: hypothetical protein ACYCVZ_07830 [Streptosporangiaceae bacterium]